MNRINVLSITFFIFGVIFLAIGLFSGEVKTGFIFIFPFIVGSGLNTFLSFIFFISAFLLFIFRFTNFRLLDLKKFEKDEVYNSQKRKSVDGGGIIFIGPIPIVFGSNWKIVMFIMALSIIIIILFLLNFKNIS